MNRRLVIVAALMAAVGSLAACSKPAQPPAKTVLNFSIISAESQQSAEGDWRPFRMDGHLGTLYERCASLVPRVA